LKTTRISPRDNRQVCTLAIEVEASQFEAFRRQALAEDRSLSSLGRLVIKQYHAEKAAA
jgi:hypothetical protein